MRLPTPRDRRNRVRQQQGDAAQLGWNRRNQRHDVDMHEVMEHVDIRIGSRDMLRWAVPRGLFTKELLFLGHTMRFWHDKHAYMGPQMRGASETWATANALIHVCA